MNKDKNRKRFLVLCVAPATILFFIFMILPTLNVFRMSLYERGAYSPNETFVGLKNFRQLLHDTQFIRSMQNMILLVVVVTIVTFAFALVFAAILTREKLRGQNFFRIVFYIPNILSVVVISGIFSAIYKPENGMLNSIIGLFRDMTDPILWKGEKLVIPSLIIAMVWQAVGYYMVMYMASMSSVPASLYESANLDGAGRLTQFFQITMPLMWTNIRTTLTFFIISTINMAFLFVKAMVAKGMSDVALSFMYNQKDAGLESDRSWCQTGCPNPAEQQRACRTQPEWCCNRQNRYHQYQYQHRQQKKHYPCCHHKRSVQQQRQRCRCPAKRNDER